MEFSKTDLFNYEELVFLITSVHVNEKAKLIAKHLSKYCFIDMEYLYTVNENITYDAHLKYNNKLLTMVSCLIEESYKNLDVNDEKNIREKHPKNYNALFTNTYTLNI